MAQGLTGLKGSTISSLIPNFCRNAWGRGEGGGVGRKEEENTVTVDTRRSWFASSLFSLASSGGLSKQRSHQVHPRAQTSPHQYLGESERERKREREREREREMGHTIR